MQSIIATFYNSFRAYNKTFHFIELISSYNQKPLMNPLLDMPLRLRDDLM